MQIISGKGKRKKMNWNEAIKIEVQRNGGKYPKLLRNRIGKVLAVIVALPLGTSLLAPVAAVMMLPIKPTVWAKSKMINFKEWRRLR